MRAIQVQFTIDDARRGEAIATDLLTERLVACAQTLGPVTSRYWWNGAIEHAEEWLILAKTTPDRLDAVIEHITARHPYAVPEIIATEITGGLDAYFDWIVAQTRTEPAG